MRKAHPNFYEVLELFLKEQTATEVTILQLQAGGLKNTKRRKVIQREEKIKLLKDELTNGIEVLNHTFLQLDTVLFHLIFK